MAILGKDLFDFSRPRTNTKIEFGLTCYWVEHESEQVPYRRFRVLGNRHHRQKECGKPADQTLRYDYLIAVPD